MIQVFDISAGLRQYLLEKAEIFSIVKNRIYAGKVPIVNKGNSAESVKTPKVSFRQSGGDPKGMNYRYTFTCTADTLKEARSLAILITNRLTNENFSIEDVDGNNLSYWAELEGSLNDSTEDITGNPEVFFNVNFESIY